MPRVFFIRHCQSVSNEKGILAGRLPFPLTQKGVTHAKSLSLLFQKRVSFLNALYVSPQLRTQQTAKPFAEIFDLDLIFDTRLQEQDWGKFSGQTYDDLEKDSNFHHPKNRNWNFIPENGEGYSDVYIRVANFLQDICQIPDNKTILCVTHGGTLRIIRGILKNTTPEYDPEVSKNGEIWQVPCLLPVPYVHEIVIWNN